MHCQFKKLQYVSYGKVVLPFIFLLYGCFLSAQNSLKVLKVYSVYDGDTFKVLLDCGCEVPIICDKISIRVNAIDCPEIRANCAREKELAYKARAFTREFLKKGKITLKNIQRGKYFRLVADVYVNGESLSLALIKQGLAVSYNGKTKGHNWCP